MSLLLHIVAKLILFAVIAVAILTLLTRLSRTKTEQTRPRSLGEWPEDKATYVNRISARRGYSSARQDLKDEQERRRA
jgi:hypothetical protein